MFRVSRVILNALIQTGALVRCEAILTQLIFEHALRIRIKAETENEKEEQPSIPPELLSTSATEASSEGTAELVGAEGQMAHAQEDSGTSTYVPSTSEGTVRPISPSSKSISSSLSKQTKAKDTKVGEGPAQKSSTGNLVGRLNNLVTTDLGNITGAKDILFVLIYTPLQVILAMLLLYLILGWRCVNMIQR